jgi:hypothetical protein
VCVCVCVFVCVCLCVWGGSYFRVVNAICKPIIDRAVPIDNKCFAH